MLRSKSIHELRGMAQSFGIEDIFSKDVNQLAQAIELKQQDMIPQPPAELTRVPYDASLMTKPPSRASAQQDVERILVDHIARGLRVTFPNPEEWHMAIGNKEDTGSLRIPLRVILHCADKIMA